MNLCSSNTLRKLTLLAMSVSFAGALSACSTTSTVKMTEAAPVTYKVGEGSSSFASLRMPEEAPSPVASMPSVRPQASPLAVPSQPQSHPVQPRVEAQPLPPVQAQPAPAPKTVDLSGIDRQLYPHMKVGKTYKVAGQTYHPHHNPDYDKIGVASWYGDKFHGKPTANGEIYNKNAMTAAHKTLPLNSYVYVTNLETGKSIKVRLNDRGPFIEGRVIDLSQAAAVQLGITTKGLGKVRVQYAGPAAIDAKDQSFVEQEARMPAPVQPRPEPQVALRAEPESYQPLRDLGETPSYMASQGQEHFSVPNIIGGNSSELGIMLPETESADAYRMPPIPQSVDQPSEDGVVTLTIKGPIHMAKSDGSVQNDPRLIPASYEAEK